MLTKLAANAEDPRTSQIGRMNTAELRALLFIAWDEMTAGTITPEQGDAISRAARERLKVIKQELKASH
jgi:hypothetical protein